MNGTQRATLRNGVMLGLFALCTTLIVYVVFEVTREQVSANERQVMLDQLATVLTATSYDNDILRQVARLHAPQATGMAEQMPYYIATQAEAITAFVFTVMAPGGYSGPIKLLIGVRPDGEVMAVRVIAHKETPGLGDAIEIKKSPWITMFNGRSLKPAMSSKWQVKKDGGQFDQLTGATISSRAIVLAVRRLLEYFAGHQGELVSAYHHRERPGQ